MSRNLKTCPYDISHQIRPERMHYHLIKCMKNHPEVSMKICPYNATHHVPASDINSHLQECPDRRIVEIQMFKLNDPIPGRHGDLSNPVVFGSSFISHPEADGQDRRQTVEQSLNTTSASSFGGGDVVNIGRKKGPIPGQRSEAVPRRGIIEKLMERKKGLIPGQRSEAVPRRGMIEKIMERKDEEEEEVILSGNLENLSVNADLSPIPELMVSSKPDRPEGTLCSKVSECSVARQLRRPKNVKDFWDP